MSDEKIRTEVITASQLIHRKACLLYDLVVTPDGSTASYVDVYDGNSANDTLRARIRCSTTVSTVWSPKHPVYLDKGLFLSFGTSLSHVTVSSKSL